MTGLNMDRYVYDDAMKGSFRDVDLDFSIQQVDVE